MSMAFVLFGCIFQLVTASAIELSVCSGVVSYLCPISSRIVLMYTALRAIMYNAASSTSVADVIKCFIMCAMLSTAPLFGGIVESLDKKKWPPAQLLAFDSLR